MEKDHDAGWEEAGSTSGVALATLVPRANGKPKTHLPLAPDAQAILAEVLRLWPQHNVAFVRGLIRLLLGHEADAEGEAYALSLLRQGTRLKTVRSLALCDEAQNRKLDLSWLPELERLSPYGPWENFRIGLRRATKAVLGGPSRLCAWVVRFVWNWEGNPFREPIAEMATHNRRTDARLTRLEECASRTMVFALDEQRREQQTRWLQARDLRAYERKVFSQNGEDGIIQEILYRIGTGTRYFVEFGVESGIECNCARLALEEGWRGLFMESVDKDFERLCERYRAFPDVRCVKAMITSQNIEALLAGNGVPCDLDLLSIDIDGNDYWVWKAIQRWRPRLVVMEYNPNYPPSKKWVMTENPTHRWGGTSYFGASLASLTALGRAKGYTLVGTNSRGVNSFFVRDDLVTPEKFLDPCVHYHYTAPDVGPFLGGNPPGSGPGLEI
jgi:hypothetical protein